MPAGSYRTKDGWIAVTLVRESHFVELCAALRRPELAADPHFADGAARTARADELTTVVDAILAGRTTAEWLETLRPAGVLCNPVNTPGDWLDDAHAGAVAAAPALDQPGLGPVPVPRIPGLPEAAHANLAAPAPGLGEHGAALLTEHGYDDAAILSMRASGALAGPPPAGAAA